MTPYAELSHLFIPTCFTSSPSIESMHDGRVELEHDLDGSGIRTPLILRLEYLPS